MKIIIKWLVVSVVSALLIGCGGGGSSDSGGGSGSVVFSGPQTIFGNGARVDGTVTITINDGVVTVSDGVDSGSAPLSADGTQFNVPININDSTITCSEPVIASGTVNGNTIEGTYSGTPVCTLLSSGLTGPVNFSGSFTATAT